MCAICVKKNEKTKKIIWFLSEIGCKEQSISELGSHAKSIRNEWKKESDQTN